MIAYDGVMTSELGREMGLESGHIPYLLDFIGEEFADEMRRETLAHISKLWDGNPPQLPTRKEPRHRRRKA